MTVTTDRGVEYRLPYQFWRNRRLVNQQDRAEASTEVLVDLYGQYDEERLLTVAYVNFSHPMPWSEFMERIERLCAISCDVADHEDRVPEWEALKADYELELTSLVTANFDSHARSAIAVVDELAEKRGQR
jgi:hypothetical protein